MQRLQRLEGVATSTAALGHGTAGSGETRPRRVRLSWGRASGVHYQANRAQRRGWEVCGGSWPRGAPTPVNFRHGYGGEERRIRPYRGSIDPAERWRRWRRSRRGYRRTGQRVFTVACAHGGCDARSAMAGGVGSALGEVRNENGVVKASGRRWLEVGATAAAPGQPRRVAARSETRRRLSPTRRPLSEERRSL